MGSRRPFEEIDTDRRQGDVLGAAITGIDDPVDEWGQYIDSGEVRRKHSLWVFSATRTTLSDAEGFYELQGLEPDTDFYRVAGYLRGGNPAGRRWVSIRAEADGFVQGKEDVPRVLLVTEESLYWARRFLQACARVYPEEDIHEKDDLYLPSLQGNTITGIDIVLDPAGTGVR